MEYKKIKDKHLNEKINASLVLGSYLDTLGFKNGDWEFNFNLDLSNQTDALLINNEIIHEFFAMGGFNSNISTWDASDDTIMMIATKKACIMGGKIEHFIKCYIDIYKLLQEKKRASGITTLKSLNILKQYRDINKIHYSDTMGGNGAAMRTSFIGIYFTDIKKIIEISILSSRLTHNYPLGFLGGMVTALFTHYAINNIEPWKWCNMLLELNENKTIDKIVEKMSIYKKYMRDKDIFWNQWYKYKEIRHSKFGLASPDYMHSSNRFTQLIEIFYEDHNKIKYNTIGTDGASTTIMAYDSILMCITNKKNSALPLKLEDKTSFIYNWESMVIFSTLHFGDNDTVGAIAGCWYGALRGFEGTNKNIVTQLEFIKDLIV